jgi:hypothetical protein
VFGNLLPEGAIPLYGIVAVTLLDKDGNRSFRHVPVGDSTNIDLMGLAEAVKLAIWEDVTMVDLGDNE